MKKTVKIELTNRYAYILEGEIPRVVVDKCQIVYSYWARDWFTKAAGVKTRILNYFYAHGNISYFPAGWLPKVKQTYEDFGYSVEVIDKRTAVTPNPLKNSFVPRDYQLPIITQALEARCGIIGAPTGSGKTLTYGGIIFYLGQPTLVVVPSVNLLNQTAKELQSKLQDPHLVGTIGDSVWNPQLITVATRDTLWNRFKEDPKKMKLFFAPIRVLVVDEAHHIKNSGYTPKNTYFKLVMEIDAPYRFGATATPGAEGGLSRSLLEAATGPVIGEIPMSELVEKGYLVRPRITMHEVPIENPIRDWHKAYQANIVGNESRNRLIAYLAEQYAAEGKSVLIVCNWVDKHARVLHHLIPSSTLMIGETDSVLRDEIKQKFEQKTKPILVSTVIQEGVNIPSMDVIILAAAGKGGDEGRVQIQRIGRVMRPSTEKDRALVIDFYDRDGEVLERHSKKRIKIYQAEDAYEFSFDGPGDKKAKASDPRIDKFAARGIADLKGF